MKEWAKTWVNEELDETFVDGSGIEHSGDDTVTLSMQYASFEDDMTVWCCKQFDVKVLDEETLKGSYKNIVALLRYWYCDEGNLDEGTSCEETIQIPFEQAIRDFGAYTLEPEV